MNKNGPIVVIEDDKEDQDILSDIFKSMDYPNEVVFFGDGDEALKYLLASKEKPFLILSDINMPKLNGFELRDKIKNNEALELKCIPYLFFTTANSQKAVIDAYSMSAQGFFTKPNTMSQLEKVLKSIIEYWQHCEAPNYTYGGTVINA